MIHTDLRLPIHLSERVRTASGAGLQDGEFVLYWMHHSVRGHENPALDVALTVAERMDLPVLVYQGLGGAHSYNSDRHHTFILEGARDVSRELARRGITYAFYLGTNSGEKSPLTRLATRASIVVAEDFPAPPFPAWLNTLNNHTQTPILAVDSCCVVPMQLVGKSCSRAFRFRNETRHLFHQRIEQRWVDVEPLSGPFNSDLPFQPVDFERSVIPELVASCEIDHGIGPVHHSPGGSVAGYSRWEKFLRHGLPTYHKTRNDAAMPPPRGVSRMSPYLHHGHVSPFRLAREASESASEGSKKFLDELLIWRELAYNFCFYSSVVEDVSALPAWALETLRRHAGDERPELFTTRTLERGKTGNALWDTAQKSLFIHGELHNNVRMTWGKALLQWTTGPEDALKTLIDLNHRYALDGSDPNSYGGLLWCLGLFDRPFKPEIPICGSVRPRSLASHEKRLDMKSFTRRVLRPARSTPLSVAVVGAGISGLAAAGILDDHGYEVTVFEKSRGPGGRMASRRRDNLTFDHGAQYFTVRDRRFKRRVASWVEEGVVEKWKGLIGQVEGPAVATKDSATERYVGVPRMSALTRMLSKGIDIRFSQRIGGLKYSAYGWAIQTDAGDEFGSYDALIVTAPAPQAAALLKDASKLAKEIEQIRMAPCWAVMAAFKNPLELELDGVFVNHDVVSWAARNSSKPGRQNTETWVIHSSPGWARANLEAEPEVAADHLLNQFLNATQHPRVTPDFIRAHRWRYALPENPLHTACLWDSKTSVAACGDWCNGSRVEGAYLSGVAAAGRVLGLPDSAGTSVATHLPAV